MTAAPAAVRNWRARQTSGTRPCGDCRRVLWVPDPRGQYWGKIRFIEKTEVKDEGGSHVDKRSQTSGMVPSASCG